MNSKRLYSLIPVIWYCLLVLLLLAWFCCYFPTDEYYRYKILVYYKHIPSCIHRIFIFWKPIPNYILFQGIHRFPEAYFWETLSILRTLALGNRGNCILSMTEETGQVQWGGSDKDVGILLQNSIGIIWNFKPKEENGESMAEFCRSLGIWWK
jgi:hypothetical protein